jgi:hypothetical protein
MQNNNQQPIQKELQQKIQRNDAIAQIMGFKKYIPAHGTKTVYEQLYANIHMQWYVVPGIGRYNSFELKFDSDWNWLISACIELKKYEYVHTKLHPGDKGFDHTTNLLYWKILNIKLINVDLADLFIKVSDYCLEVLRQKQAEKL